MTPRPAHPRDIKTPTGIGIRQFEDEPRPTSVAAPNTCGGGIDPLAVVGRAPEDRNWKPGDPAFEPVVHPNARIEALSTVDAGTKRPTQIDEGAWLFKGVHLGHDVRVEAFAEIGTHSTIGGHVVIGAHARIGIGVTILPYRKVGHHAHVGAGAVVVKDVPPYATVVGNPARILRDDERDPRPHSERTSDLPPEACSCGRAHPLRTTSMPLEPPDNVVAKILPTPGSGARMPDSVVNYENGGERRSLGSS